MGGHVIPEAQKVNTAVMNALPRPLSTLYTFLYPLHAKTFQVFGKNWKLDLSLLKILVGSWRKSSDFSSTKISSTCWSLKLKKEKYVTLESIGYLKKSTIIHSFCTTFWCLLHSLDEVILSLAQVHNIGYWRRNAQNHQFLGILSLKGVFLWFTVRNPLTDNWTQSFLWANPVHVPSVIHFSKTCSSSSLSTCRGPIENSENLLEQVRNVMAHGDAWEGKWRGKRRMEWVASSLAPFVGTWSIQHYYQQQKHTTSWLAAW